MSLPALLLCLVPPPAGDPRAELVERWRAHYARVERELLAGEPAGLGSEQRAERAALIAVPAGYRERGDFTQQDSDPLALVPRFVDAAGRRCAVAERLQALLLGRDLELRRSAALALAKSPQPGATGALMTAYELESEPLARGFALLSLGQRGGLPARDLLLEELERGPIAVEPWAALGLGLLARASNDAASRAALLEGIGRARNEESRPAFLVALGLAREARAVAPARAALERGESPRERGYAATCLALLGGGTNRDFLRARMALERSAFVRAAIAQALSTLGDERDATGLFEALVRLADPGLRAVTAASLGLLGAPAALAGLEELAREGPGSHLVRATALDGLGVLLDRSEPLVLPEVSQGANFALYEDWVFDLFQLTL